MKSALKNESAIWLNIFLLVFPFISNLVRISDSSLIESGVSRSASSAVSKPRSKGHLYPHLLQNHPTPIKLKDQLALEALKQISQPQLREPHLLEQIPHPPPSPL